MLQFRSHPPHSAAVRISSSSGAAGSDLILHVVLRFGSLHVVPQFGSHPPPWCCVKTCRSVTALPKAAVVWCKGKNGRKSIFMLTLFQFYLSKNPFTNFRERKNRFYSCQPINYRQKAYLLF